MSVDFSTKVIFGYALTERMNNEDKIKYNENTGEPYTIQEYKFTDYYLEENPEIVVSEFLGQETFEDLQLIFAYSYYGSNESFLGVQVVDIDAGCTFVLDTDIESYPEIAAFAEKYQLEPNFFILSEIS